MFCTVKTFLETTQNNTFMRAKKTAASQAHEHPVSAVRNTANAILITWLEYQVQNVTMPIHVHVPPIV